MGILNFLRRNDDDEDEESTREDVRRGLDTTLDNLDAEIKANNARPNDDGTPAQPVPPSDSPWADPPVPPPF